MNKKIITVKTFQEKTVFRTPYSMEVMETYPLPPYSTILGFIHNMLSSSETIEGINISIQGHYGNLTREFCRYQKYESESIEGKFYPIIITFLIDLELMIHIKMPSEDLHVKLLSCLKNPPYFPYLGRPEDLILSIEVEEGEEIEFDPECTEEGAITIPYDCYVPIYIANNLEISGVPFLLPSYYKIKVKTKDKKKENQEIFRNFEIVKVIYAQAGQTVLKKIKVDNKGIPLWWMK